MQFQTILQTIFIITGIAILISLVAAFNIIRTGRKSPYFRIRQQRVAAGWRMIGIACILSLFAALIFRFGGPFAQPGSLTATATAQIPGLSQVVGSSTPTAGDLTGAGELATGTPSASLPTISFSTNSASQTAGMEVSKTATASLAPGITATGTVTPPPTSTLKPTLTPSLTNTHAPTLTPSMTLTVYPTWTLVFTQTVIIPTHAPTPTLTVTQTPTSTRTPANTATLKPSPSPTATLTP
jgi:hypothetical protein